MIPAALLNFLAGLAAGAGINYLTSIEGGSNAPQREIVIDAIVWVIAAICLAYAAHLVEDVEREVSLRMRTTFSLEEKRDLRKRQAKRVKWRYRVTISASAMTTVAASVLTPGLIHY